MNAVRLCRSFFTTSAAACPRYLCQAGQLVRTFPCPNILPITQRLTAHLIASGQYIGSSRACCWMTSMASRCVTLAPCQWIAREVGNHPLVLLNLVFWTLIVYFAYKIILWAASHIRNALRSNPDGN